MTSTNTSPAVPVANPGAQFQAYREEIRAAIDRVLESGWYILGKEVKAFEEEFAKYVDCKFCIGVGNGTDALAISLKALGVGPGDEVITVSHSAVATVAAIEQVGATPVFADIEADTRCLSATSFESKIGPKTKVVIPVHIYGQPARMDQILKVARSRGIKVLEDCAQSHGARVGTARVGSMGNISAFSFYPTKNLGAIGDGGGIVTNDPELAEKVRLIQQYGWKERYVSVVQGVNTRLDELQAAILRVKLPHLDSDNEKRRNIAARYSEALKGSKAVLPGEIPGFEHVMHLYVVELDGRGNLQKFLLERGVQSAYHYPMAIHQQPAYLGRVRGGNELPTTEALYRRLISLPMYPELSDQQVTQVTDALKDWVRTQS